MKTQKCLFRFSFCASNIFFSHNEIHSLLYVDTGLGKKVYWQKMENTTLGFHIGNIKSL